MAQFSQKDRHGFAVIAVVVALGMGLLIWNFTLSNAPEADARNCLGEISQKTVILIDRSDDTPTQTVDEIVSRIRSLVSEQVGQNELVSIFRISDSAQTSLRPIFSSCKPKADGNDLYESRKTIQRQFQDSFIVPLEEALKEPAVRSEASPVAEVITDLSLSDYLTADESRLFVFSDLMQNSDNVSLYGCRAPQIAIDTFRSHRVGAVERPEFKNLSVSLNIIPREGMDRSVINCRDGFWLWYFGNNEGPNAGLESKYLPGGAAIQ